MGAMAKGFVRFFEERMSRQGLYFMDETGKRGSRPDGRSISSASSSGLATPLFRR